MNEKERQKQVQTQMNLDHQSVEDAFNGNRSFDYYALKRLLLTELAFDGLITENHFCGYSKKTIREMSEKPWRYTKNLVQLSEYMYLKSGYYKRLVNYFATMGKYCWTVDVEARNAKFNSVKENELQNKLFQFISYINELKLEHELSKILMRIFLHDACFGYLVETEFDRYIYYFPPEYCEIKTNIHGMYGYAIRTGSFSGRKLALLPPELQELVISAKNANLSYTIIPIEKSICIKYHEHFHYLYPPLFSLISNILDIDDYKDLAKAKTEQEAYRLIWMKIPTTDEGNLAMGDNVIVPFTNMAKEIVPKTIGVVPSPMEVQAIQFKSDQSERDKVEDATTQLYAEAGVSQSLMAGTSSGSELDTSIKVDSGDIFRIYRQIERLVNFQAKLNRKSLFPSYLISFSMLDITVFNEDKAIEREFKLAQASVPNKMRLLAAAGINPAKMLGNMFVENNLLQLSESWTVLKTSATQSTSEQAGRPTTNDSTIAKTTEVGRENGSNDPRNRSG